MSPPHALYNYAIAAGTSMVLALAEQAYCPGFSMVRVRVRVRVRGDVFTQADPQCIDTHMPVMHACPMGRHARPTVYRYTTNAHKSQH